MRFQETLCLIATAMGNPIRIPRPIHTQTDPLSLCLLECASPINGHVSECQSSQASSISRADNSPLSRITRTSHKGGRGAKRGKGRGLSRRSINRHCALNNGDGADMRCPCRWIWIDWQLAAPNTSRQTPPLCLSPLPPTMPICHSGIVNQRWINSLAVFGQLPHVVPPTWHGRNSNHFGIIPDKTEVPACGSSSSPFCAPLLWP